MTEPKEDWQQVPISPKKVNDILDEATVEASGTSAEEFMSKLRAEAVQSQLDRDTIAKDFEKYRDQAVFTEKQNQDEIKNLKLKNREFEMKCFKLEAERNVHAEIVEMLVDKLVEK